MSTQDPFSIHEMQMFDNGRSPQLCQMKFKLGSLIMRGWRPPRRAAPSRAEPRRDADSRSEYSQILQR